MTKIHCLLIAVLMLALSACSTGGGNMHQSTGTDVSLRSNNYKMIKAGATGESSGFYLLGFIPFASPNYADAKKNLYQSAGKSLEGRSIALANQTEDKSILYLILFSIPRLTLTADIVEFDGPASDGQ